MKITYGIGIVDASGSLAGNTASRNASGAYMRKRVKPTNPKTPAQSAVRSSFTNASQAWRGLTDDQRLGWAGLAKNFSARNSLGQALRYTGSQLFNKLNLNLSAAGQAQIEDAPTLAGVVNLSSFSVTTVAATPSLKAVFAPALPAGQKLIIYATPNMSAGINNANKEFRQVTVLGSTDTSPKEIFSAWSAVFGGTLTIGSKIFLKAKPVDSATGQAGQEVTASIIVS